MDRFLEETAADLMHNYNLHRFGSPEPALVECPNCKRLVREEDIDLIPGWNFRGCRECAAQSALLLSREDAQGEPLCPVEYDLLLISNSIAEMHAALKAHQGAECVHCGSVRKTVEMDRELLHQPAAVCCEGKAA